jgi:hypothetical protein
MGARVYSCKTHSVTANVSGDNGARRISRHVPISRSASLPSGCDLVRYDPSDIPEDSQCEITSTIITDRDEYDKQGRRRETARRRF